MFGFDDPAAVARYTEGPVRQVPGFAEMQRMALLLLSETAPPAARILVLGAGGGLELRAFATARPAWHFTGVDPSAEMLALARQVAADSSDRIDFIEGEIDAAPTGPFDGATCLLTLHFVPRAERLRILQQLHRRLKPGAPLAVVHHSIPQAPGEPQRWLARYAAFAAASGLDPAKAASAATAIAERLPLLSPEEDEALLRQAGFTDVSLFYAAFTFRGWVATA